MKRKMALPLVTIVLPVYNAEKYILFCLDSIFNQTYINWELIIINDGSTDQTDKLIRDQLKKVLHKTIYLKLPENHYPAYCRNLGTQYATGLYIAAMDADDIMLPSRLEKQVDFLEQHPNIGIVSSPTIDITSEGIESTGLIVPLNDVDIKRKLIAYCTIVQGAMLVRTALLKSFNYEIAYKCGEDYELYLRLAAVTQFANLPEPLLKRRVHAHQLTASKKAHWDTLQIKWDYFRQTKTLWNNHWYLWRHLFILLTPTFLFLFLKKRKHKKKKIAKM
jgi:glycosyltransferase involved in cell wall biosynthesis